MVPILKVEKLSVHFKNDQGLTKSVQHISFEIQKGKICGIVEGNISIFLENNKIDLINLTESEKIKLRGSKIAMVFQEPMTSLNPVLTCGYQISEVLQIHLGLSKTEAEKRTIELVEEVGLARPEKRLNSYADE